MKNRILLFLFLVSISFVNAQSFNYQAVVRNAGGDPVTNQSIGVQVQILVGAAPNTVVYTETHTVTSSAQGVISLSIGTGTTSDTFSNINWSQQNQWIGIAVDITGGTTYTSIGTSKLQQVPYALYAATTGDKIFSTTSNVTSNAPGNTATDDFLFGSSQLASVSGTADDNRLFFDKSKGAFRVGQVTGTQWNDPNIGFYSSALGSNNITTGTYSFATGISNNVTGYAASTLGDNNIVLGNGATAAGIRLTAESFTQFTIGQWNTAHTGSPDASGWINTDRLLVIGNGISGSSKSDALVMLKNGNTTLNGELTIDGDNQGVGASYTLPAQDGTANQVMTTDGAGNVSWVDASSGVFSTSANVTSNASGDITMDDFVFGSTQLENDTNTTDDDKRMFFDKSKAAFRAGLAVGTNWDDVNVGFGSIALGNQTTASGGNAVSIGAYSTAEGLSSATFGEGNYASGRLSMTLGRNLVADSRAQISLGIYNTIEANGDKENWVETDRLFVIGNGGRVVGATRSDALIMLKNGNTTLNGQLTIDGDNQGAGTSYTLPAQDGTANQVMTTDGSGAVSWVDPLALPAGGTNGQVLQTDGAGNYSWTNNTEAPGAYTSATLNSSDGWENYNAAFGVTNFQDPRYRINDNIVYLEGMVRKNTAIDNGDTIMTLPVGFRPAKTRIFSVETENGSIRVDVNPNGTVLVATGFNINQNWISLDGITFSVD